MSAERRTLWCLEVLRAEGSMYKVHSGYMRKLFASRREAAEYYNAHNPHMPSMPVGGGGGRTLVVSAEDPESGFSYAVRLFVGGLLLSVHPFEEGGAGASEERPELRRAMVLDANGRLENHN